MTGQGNTVQIDREGAGTRSLVRWECRCRVPPVLLATYDDQGRIHIKARDRYWHVAGVVQTVCPRCGSEHTLQMEGEKGEKEHEGDGWQVTGDSKASSPSSSIQRTAIVNRPKPKADSQ